MIPLLVITLLPELPILEVEVVLDLNKIVDLELVRLVLEVLVFVPLDL